MDSSESPRFAKKAHIRYALRHLRMLPPPYQSDDSNRITFGFFALGSLAMLGGLDRLAEQEREDYIEWIYQRWNHTIGGFGGAPNVDLRDHGPDDECFDHPHLTHTYTALLILALLSLPSSETREPKSPYGSLDLPKLLKFVGKCQSPNGSFGCFPGSSEQDVRFVYCAVAILSMVNVDPSTVIDVRSTVAFLEACRRYEGGYGQAPHLEAQGGTTYCVLASLALLNHLKNSLTNEEAQQTIRWLVDRQVELIESDDSDEKEEDGTSSTTKSQQPDPPSLQIPPPDSSLSHSGSVPPAGHNPRQESSNIISNAIAGFQGRIGKPLDACYSFWCTAALTIISLRHPTTSDNLAPVSTAIPGVLYNPEANIDFLLLCQSKQWGGIARFPDDHPDVYHTYLALASIALSFASSNKLSKAAAKGESDEIDGSNPLTEHDPLLNVPMIASRWIRKCFSA